jgi:purine-cytosine permease-like protein
LVIDYLAVRRDHYALENLRQGPDINVRAFIAWLAGAGFAIGEIAGSIASPSGFPALEAAAITALTYAALVLLSGAPDRARVSS